MTYHVQFLNGKHWTTVTSADGGFWTGSRNNAIHTATVMREHRKQKFRIRLTA